MIRFLFETVILLIFGATAVFLYVEYWDTVQYALFGDTEHHTIYVGSTAVIVSVADDQDERIQGLSGVKRLGDFEGKLFIFDSDGKHGIWMKDMLIPLDIIWFDSNLKVVSIEQNVTPDTYPQRVFYPQKDARFVLETNAYFVSSVKISIGDTLLLPPTLIPYDIRQNLQQ